MKFKESKTKIKTNMKESKRIVASIGNPVKMLKLFTKDLYKNPLQTAIQEYINNAKDAHLMAKKDTSSIQITFPTVANQNITIKDTGLGLSPEEVENVFAKITSSNKDNSNLFNGGFGIGSKSWFAVHPHFFVISTYNKIKTYYEVSFEENIYIDVQSEEETTEGNGVEVILPLANSNQIEEASLAIKRAIRFWKHRPVLINGELNPLPVIFEDKDFKLIAIDGKSQLFVTLGETQYSVNDFEDLKSYFKRNFPSCSLEIKFKVGEAKLNKSQEVGPDRENFVLEMVPHIRKKLDKALKKMPKIILDFIKEQKDFKVIQKIVNNPFYSKQNYKVELQNLSLRFLKKSNYPQVLSFGNKINTPVSRNSYPWLSDDIIFITHKNDQNFIKNHTKIADQIIKELYKKDKKGYTICFIIEDDVPKEKLDSLKKLAKVKNLSSFKFKLPKPFEDKFKEENPSISILSKGKYSNGKFLIRAGSIEKLKSINPEAVFICTTDYPHNKKTTNDLISNLRKVKQDFYFVSDNYMKLVRHFKLKTLDINKLNKRIEEIKQKEALAIQKKREEREIKFKQEINDPKTHQMLKYFQLISSTDIENIHALNYILKNSTLEKMIKDLKNRSIHKIHDTGRRLLKKFKSETAFYNHFKQEKDALVLISKIKEEFPIFFQLVQEYVHFYDSNGDFNIADGKAKEIMILANYIKKTL